jgi:guanylate kinase
VSGEPTATGLRTFPLIFAAPSGSGKTTIARELRARRRDVEFSVSCTTRASRPGERDGVDYHFRSEEQFLSLVADGELLEWARVHGHLYGTPRLNLEQARTRHHFLLLDIDVQGSRQIKRSVPEAVSVFVLPPSANELARRLVGRGSEDADVQARRLLAARGEIAAAIEFDYVIVNDDLQSSVAAVESILAAESLRTSRQTDLPGFVNRLVRDIDSLLQT